MNSEPRFWAGKILPTFAAMDFHFPSGKRFVTAQFHGRKTHATTAAALTMTAQRQRMTKSISG